MLRAEANGNAGPEGSSSEAEHAATHSCDASDDPKSTLNNAVWDGPDATTSIGKYKMPFALANIRSVSINDTRENDSGCASINALPDELLEVILQHVYNDEAFGGISSTPWIDDNAPHKSAMRSPTDLSQCQRVCRRWFSIATCILWRLPKLPARAGAAQWIAFVHALEADNDRGNLYRASIECVHDLWLFRMSDEELLKSCSGDKVLLKSCSGDEELVKPVPPDYSFYGVFSYMLDSCLRLRQVHLSLAQWPNDDMVLAMPWRDAMPRLTHLTLDHALITDDMLQTLFNGDDLPYAMQSLHCRSCWLGDRSLALIARRCPRLRSLRLGIDYERQRRRNGYGAPSDALPGMTAQGLRAALGALGYIRDLHITPLHVGRMALEAQILNYATDEHVQSSQTIRRRAMLHSTTLNAAHNTGLTWDVLVDFFATDVADRLLALNSLTLVGYKDESRSSRRALSSFNVDPCPRSNADRVLAEPAIFALAQACPRLRTFTIRDMDLQVQSQSSGTNSTFTTYVSVQYARWEVDELVMRFRQVFPQVNLIVE